MTLRFPRAKFIHRRDEDQPQKLQTAFSLESESLASLGALRRGKANFSLPSQQPSGISAKKTNA